MTALRSVCESVLIVVPLFPESIQPGVFLSFVLLLLWLIVKRRKVIWNAVMRAVAYCVDAFVGGILVAEFALTSYRRNRGDHPGEIDI
jgi:hypothetical protein